MEHRDSEQKEKEAALRLLVRGALERRRQVLVYEVARRFRSILDEQRVSPESASEIGTNWVRIESLSQLRALVGGRFQNLKDRWTGAGFPLREHRGDRSGKKEFDNEGWIQLSAWIHKQGFELRLANEEEPWLFELRKIS